MHKAISCFIPFGNETSVRRTLSSIREACPEAPIYLMSVSSAEKEFDGCPIIQIKDSYNSLDTFEKIALYLGEESEITIDLVEDLVAKTLEHDAFKMLNAYLEHQQEEALRIYHDLLRQKEEPIKLVGLLANNIRTMNHIFYLQKKGYHQQQIAKQLKIHPYRVQIISGQRNRPSEERLLQALYSLAEVDLQLKTTGGNRERHLELFLMKKL